MNQAEPTAVNRRSFLKMAALSSTGLLAMHSPPVDAAKPPPNSPGKLIDVNVSLFQWPTRRLPLDDPKALAAKLKRAGVARAWAASFEGLLHKDLGAVNSRLTEVCSNERLFLPIGVINPTLPAWPKDLLTCAQTHHMKGIRLYPNYHGYRLDDPVVGPLLQLAAELGFFVQIALVMEDERLQNPMLRAKPVDAGPLLPHLAKTPGLKIILINWAKNTRLALASDLAKAGQVFFDIAMFEGVGGIETLLKNVPRNRIVFGSHAPFFYLEAAQLKLRESPLSPPELEAISRGNAASLMA